MLASLIGHIVLAKQVSLAAGLAIAIVWIEGAVLAMFVFSA